MMSHTAMRWASSILGVRKSLRSLPSLWHLQLVSSGSSSLHTGQQRESLEPWGKSGPRFSWSPWIGLTTTSPSWSPHLTQKLMPGWLSKVSSDRPIMLWPLWQKTWVSTTTIWGSSSSTRMWVSSLGCAPCTLT